MSATKKNGQSLNLFLEELICQLLAQVQNMDNESILVSWRQVSSRAVT